MFVRGHTVGCANSAVARHSGVGQFASNDIFYIVAFCIVRVGAGLFSAHGSSGEALSSVLYGLERFVSVFCVFSCGVQETAAGNCLSFFLSFCENFCRGSSV